MKNSLLVLAATVALAGCATFGVNTAPPEPPVPAFIANAFPWGFDQSTFSFEVASSPLVCGRSPAGMCEMKFDRRVGHGYAQVLYYRDRGAHIAVLSQPYYLPGSNPDNIAAWFRVNLVDQGMLVPPVERNLGNNVAVVTYTGIRNGQRVRGKMTAFYSSYPGTPGRPQLNVIYGEWPEKDNAPMASTFTQIAVALGYPMGLD